MYYLVQDEPSNSSKAAVLRISVFLLMLKLLLMFLHHMDKLDHVFKSANSVQLYHYITHVSPRVVGGVKPPKLKLLFEFLIQLNFLAVFKFHH
jgi:hypothetical protein